MRETFVWYTFGPVPDPAGKMQMADAMTDSEGPADHETNSFIMPRTLNSIKNRNWLYIEKKTADFSYELCCGHWRL
jgi:hypothetical protein